MPTFHVPPGGKRCTRCLGSQRLFSPEGISFVCPHCSGLGYELGRGDYRPQSALVSVEPEGERRGIDCTCPSCREEAAGALGLRVGEGARHA